MENSSIEWCDHTFNLWRGCREVSPGCANCYARELSKRNPAVLGCWGKGAPRVLAKPAYRKKPLRWNQDAAAGRFRECAGCGRREARGWDGIGLTRCSTPGCLALSETESSPVRPRVFCASLSDWLDEEVSIEWLVHLLQIVHATPHLDWLMLTKRPQNWQDRTAAAFDFAASNGEPKQAGQMDFLDWLGAWTHAHIAPANVWAGTTVEDQARADERIPLLLSIPGRVRFLSCEPLLGPVEFSDVTRRSDAVRVLGHRALEGVHWVICGGESGQYARPMHPEWARSIQRQCQAVGVPFLYKQWGAWLPAKIIDEKTFQVSTPKEHPGPKRPEFYHWHDRFPGDVNISAKVGKEAAGRLLDGRVWNGMPGEAVAA